MHIVNTVPLIVTILPFWHSR